MEKILFNNLIKCMMYYSYKMYNRISDLFISLIRVLSNYRGSKSTYRGKKICFTVNLSSIMLFKITLTYKENSFLRDQAKPASFQNKLDKAARGFQSMSNGYLDQVDMLPQGGSCSC